MISLDDTVAFLVTVDESTLSSAAEKLGLSVSTVTKRINRLEEQLKAKLIIRTSRGIKLTPAGSVFFSRCSSLIETVNAAAGEVGALYSGEGGELRIHSSFGAGTRLVAPIVSEFAKAKPDVRIQLMTYERENIRPIGQFGDVFVGNLDITNKKLVSRRLGSLPYIVCASRRYIETHGRPKTPDDLRNHNCVLYYDSKTRSVFDEWTFADNGRHYSVKVQGSVTVNNSASIFEMLMRNVGICLMPNFAVRENIDAGIVEEIFYSNVTFARELNAYFPRADHLPANLTAFLEFFEAKIKMVQ